MYSMMSARSETKAEAEVEVEASQAVAEAAAADAALLDGNTPDEPQLALR